MADDYLTNRRAAYEATTQPCDPEEHHQRMFIWSRVAHNSEPAVLALMEATEQLLQDLSDNLNECPACYSRYKDERGPDGRFQTAHRDGCTFAKTDAALAALTEGTP